MPSKLPSYKTAYSEMNNNHVYITESGSQLQNEYGYEIDSYGRKVLVKTGETNLYQKIQEQLEETKIENILRRAMAGDNSVFRPEGIYADLTEMPSNLLEARQSMQKLENVWQELPKELKAKYNYDLDQFIGQSGSEQWLRDMGLLKEQPKETITPKTETKEESKDE